MASLSLPPPINKLPLAVAAMPQANENAISATKSTTVKVGQGRGQVGSKRRSPPPSYEDRCRAALQASKMPSEERRRRKIKLFVPRSLEDFGADGGAYPEIHVAQYPRHMGNPHNANKSSKQSMADGAQNTSSRALLNVEIDQEGNVSYDAIVKSGTNANKIVYAKHDDLVPSKPKPDDIAMPSKEEEEETTAKTQAALMALLQSKTALDKPSGSAIENAKTSQNIEEKTKFIRYTPRPDAPGYNPSASQRVIQMVPAKVDPMMPPKHKHVKAPPGPAEDPVPVLHAPPTKLTKEERDAWNIPACISNWKNTRGYTIPLDKRLAADGRGLREHTINSNFATLSESLYVAERQARTEVKLRAHVQKKIAYAEKERREQELRELANQSRLERSGAVTATQQLPANDENNQDGATNDDRNFIQERNNPIPSFEGDRDSVERSQPVKIETDEEVAARQREKLRTERKREREKELRMENNKEIIKKKRFEDDRDVSEKIALGVHTGSGGGSHGVDSRLYNQSAGMDSGFGKDDEYNTYSKPLWGDRQTTGSSIYRPTRGDTQHNADDQYDDLLKGATNKFRQPNKGFAGAEGGRDNQMAQGRTAPVQFENSGNK